MFASVPGKCDARKSFHLHWRGFFAKMPATVTLVLLALATLGNTNEIKTILIVSQRQAKLQSLVACDFAKNRQRKRVLTELNLICFIGDVYSTATKA
jgi:hypothetical protein